MLITQMMSRFFRKNFHSKSMACCLFTILKLNIRRTNRPMISETTAHISHRLRPKMKMTLATTLVSRARQMTMTLCFTLPNHARIP